MRLNRLAAAAAVPLIIGASAGVLAGCSSAGSSSTGSSSAGSSSGTGTSGTETFAGIENLTAAQANSQNYVPVISLSATGAFIDTGSIALIPGSGKDGNGPGPATVKLSQGNISIHHAASNPNAQPVPMPKIGPCVYGLAQKVSYTITGGTGRYARATGSGVATVTFDFNLPQIAVQGHTGGLVCDTRNSAMATGGKVTFTAIGPVSVP